MDLGLPEEFPLVELQLLFVSFRCCNRFTIYRMAITTEECTDFYLQMLQLGRISLWLICTFPLKSVEQSLKSCNTSVIKKPNKPLNCSLTNMTSRSALIFHYSNTKTHWQ